MGKWIWGRTEREGGREKEKKRERVPATALRVSYMSLSASPEWPNIQKRKIPDSTAPGRTVLGNSPWLSAQISIGQLFSGLS